jgi:hypothetical protein
MSSPHLITTTPKGELCPRCRCVTIAGIAEGLHARVDLTPLNPAGELAALLTDRWTYTLTRAGLVYRDSFRIASGHLRGPVLPAHRCGQSIPVEHLEINDSAVTSSAPESGKPPF